MSRFIAVQECADGNESVGSEWIETRSFDSTATIAEVWMWAQSLRVHNGRLILRIDAALEAGF